MKEIIISGLTVEIEKKKIKNVYLRILPPEGRIHISAPLRMSEAEIKKFVLSKVDWIIEQQSKVVARSEKNQISYDNGDLIPIWGNRVPLIVHEDSTRSKVTYDGENIHIFIKKGSADSRAYREAMLNEWYRMELKDELPRVIEKCEKVIGVKSSDFTIRDMKTRWGTCNVRTGRICFNLQLAKKPYRCLVYVVIHELVHLLERSHNHVFKRYMDQFLPEWRMIKKELNDQV